MKAVWQYWRLYTALYMCIMVAHIQLTKVDAMHALLHMLALVVASFMGDCIILVY